MRQYQQRHRVRTPLQLRLIQRQQLHPQILKLQPTARDFPCVHGGEPVGVVIGEDGSAHHRQAEVEPSAGEVVKHSFVEVAFGLGLDFEVDEHELLGSVFEVDLEEFVDDLGGGLAGREQALEFVLEGEDGLVPVDELVEVGEGELEEGLEEAFKDFFPRIIVLSASHKRGFHLREAESC